MRAQVGPGIGLLALLAVGAVVMPPRAAHAQPRIGDAAPGLVGGNGNDDLRSGRPVAVAERLVIVEFFATWCSACQRSLNDTLAVHAQLPPDDAAKVAIVVVDVGEAPDDVRRFFAQQRVPEHVAVVADVDRSRYRAWGATRLPTAFVVDGHGRIRHINRGHGPGFRARLGRWLGRCLGEN